MGKPIRILLALENEEVHVLEIGSPIIVPPLRVHDAEVLRCPRHPPIYGDLKVYGDVALYRGLQGVRMSWSTFEIQGPL